MSNFGPAPLLMTRKISPSVDPRSHLSSVRLDGCVPSGAIGPFPLASVPWQKRQFFVNSAFPAAIDSGLEATGFFIALPAAPPPGSWAPADAVMRATHAIANAGMRPVDIRQRMMDSSPSMTRLLLNAGRQARSAADSHIPVAATATVPSRLPYEPVVIDEFAIGVPGRTHVHDHLDERAVL